MCWTPLVLVAGSCENCRPILKQQLDSRQFGLPMVLQKEEQSWQLKKVCGAFMNQTHKPLLPNLQNYVLPPARIIRQ